MAIGFPASYKTQVDLDGPRQRGREAAIYSFEILGWRYEMVNLDLYRAKIPINLMTWGETITVDFSVPDVVIVESKCTFPMQIIDWGRNRRNVNEFLSHFSSKLTRDAKLARNDLGYFDTDGKTPVQRALMDE